MAAKALGGEARSTAWWRRVQDMREVHGVASNGAEYEHSWVVDNVGRRDSFDVVVTVGNPEVLCDSRRVDEVCHGRHLEKYSWRLGLVLVR